MPISLYPSWGRSEGLSLFQTGYQLPWILGRERRWRKQGVFDEEGKGVLNLFPFLLGGHANLYWAWEGKTHSTVLIHYVCVSISGSHVTFCQWFCNDVSKENWKMPPLLLHHWSVVHMWLINYYNSSSINTLFFFYVHLFLCSIHSNLCLMS